MLSESLSDTKKLYDDIIEDVIRKLQEQSTQGNLQMSESEIVQLRHVLPYHQNEGLET
jgi:transcriptional regulator CtsR